MSSILKIIEDTKTYYDTKLEAHGTTPLGVDWNGSSSQELRFKNLLTVCDLNQTFTLNDFGCGYGALYPYASKLRPDLRYYGLDISEAMVQKAREAQTENTNCQFTTDFTQLPLADYSIASGIFNVKQDCDPDTWLTYCLSLLDQINQVSKKGFAFNCLTSHSDPEFMRNHLYYADPSYFFNHCKTHYAKNIALLHDYGLYEFTIIVRKVLE